MTCDACNQSSFQLRRYKCLRCFDYDLCGDCFDNERESIMHSKTHPMQCLLLEADKDIFFQNDKSRFRAQSHTCPICGALGFREAELATHVFTEHPPGHPSSKTEVICPICASSSDGSPNLQTQSFAQHLTSKHRLKKLAKPVSSTEEEAVSAASKSASQSSAISSRPSHRSHPLLPLSSSANPPFSWNAFGSSCNSQRTSLANAVATADDELAHLFSLQSVRKVLTTSPRRPSTSDRSKCLQVTPSFSVSKAPSLSCAATRRLSNSSLSMDKNMTETTASSTAPTGALNGATAAITSERKHSSSGTLAFKETSSGDPLGVSNSAQATSNTSMSNPRIVNASNDTASTFPQNCTDRQAQKTEAEPTARITDGTSVSLKLGPPSESDQARNPSADAGVQDEVNSTNLVSLVMNSNDGYERGKLEMAKSNKVSIATPSSNCDAATTALFAKPGKKTTAKELEDRSVYPYDTFDPEWSSFLHELIWQSLQIPCLSNLFAEPAQPNAQPKTP